MVYSDNVASIYFEALKGGLYHSMRAEFFASWRIRSVTITLAIGLVAIIIAGNNYSLDIVATLLSGIAFIISFLSFALSFTDKVYFHKSLSSRWKDLVRAIDDKRIDGREIKPQEYKSFVRERNLIIKDEYIIYRGLDSLAHNSISSGYGQVLVIPWYVHLFRNYIKFSGKRFTSVKIMEPKPKTKEGK